MAVNWSAALKVSDCRLRNLSFDLLNNFALGDSQMLWSLEWEDNQQVGGRQPLCFGIQVGKFPIDRVKVLIFS